MNNHPQRRELRTTPRQRSCLRVAAEPTRNVPPRPQVRSVVAVGDIVDHLLFFVRGGARSAPGVYCMGGPERLSRIDIAHAVARARGYKIECARAVQRASLPPGPVVSPLDISMDSAALQRVTGVTPTPLAALLASAL